MMIDTRVVGLLSIEDDKVYESGNTRLNYIVVIVILSCDPINTGNIACRGSSKIKRRQLML